MLGRWQCIWVSSVFTNSAQDVSSPDSLRKFSRMFSVTGEAMLLIIKLVGEVSQLLVMVNKCEGELVCLAVGLGAWLRTGAMGWGARTPASCSWHPGSPRISFFNLSLPSSFSTGAWSWMRGLRDASHCSMPRSELGEEDQPSEEHTEEHLPLWTHHLHRLLPASRHLTWGEGSKWAHLTTLPIFPLKPDIFTQRWQKNPQQGQNPAIFTYQGPKPSIFTQ